MLTDLADACRATGLRVVELPNWKTRTRPASAGGFDPVGLCVHHTGSLTNTREYAEWMATQGRSDLPPPLTQLALDRFGVVYICAAGRANHAGSCRAVGDWLKAGDGNTQLLGIEAMNTGTEGWVPIQYEAYVRLCAGLCSHYGWPASHVVAHKETSTTGKWDPGLLDMDLFRRDVAAHLKGYTLPDLDDIRQMVLNPKAAKGEQITLAEALRVAAQTGQRNERRLTALLKSLTGLPDELAEAVRADVDNDLAAGGGIEPGQLRRIVYAEASRAINTRLGSLNEGE